MDTATPTDFHPSARPPVRDMTAHELGHDMKVARELGDRLVAAQHADDATSARAIGLRLQDALRRLADDVDHMLVGGGGDLETVQRQPTHLGWLARRVIRAHPVQDHEIDVVTADLVLNVDRVKVDRIVDNLLTNALEHTPSGSKIRVTVDAVPGGAQIVVEDDGPGVPDDIRDALLTNDPGEAAVQPADGVVGLWLVVRLTHLHGGTVDIGRGSGGTGARIAVRLPARIPARRRRE